MPQIIPVIAPLLGGLAGGLLDKGAAGNHTEALNKIINQYMSDYSLGRGEAFGDGGVYAGVKDQARNEVGRSNDFMYGTPDNPGGAFNQFNQTNNSTFSPEALMKSIMGGQFDPYGQQIPGVQGALQGLGGVQQGMQGTTDIAKQLFAGGGWTPQSQDFFDRNSLLSQGQSIPQQGLTNMANNIFGSNGADAMTESYRNAAAQGITGRNTALDAGIGAAQGIYGAHGQTDPTNQGISQALSMLQNGGATPTTDYLQNRGMDLASREALLPPELVASMARDQSATDYSNNMEQAQRQALARGGGPGATVANGLQNKSMAEYADKGAELSARAGQNAMLQQQGLQLQQQGQGANMAESGAGIATNRYGTGSSSLQGLAGLQSQRELGALGLIPGMSQTGINQAQVYGNLGLDSAKNDLTRLGLGANMYNDVNSSQNTSLSNMNSRITNQGNYALGGGQLANSGGVDMAGILNQILTGNLNTSLQGMGRTGMFLNNAQTGIGNQAGQMGLSTGQANFNQTSLQNLLGLLSNFTQNARNQWGALSTDNAPPSESPWTPLVQNSITGLSGLIKPGQNKQPNYGSGVGTDQNGESGS